jgi:hypothetical protein
MVWERRYGTRAVSTGNGLQLQSDLKADIEGNIFQFIDNNAIYSGASENNLTLVDNVFSFNGWSNYRHEPKMIDDGNIAQLADVGFKKVSGNVLANPNIPLEAPAFEAYILRASAEEGSKLKPEQWADLRKTAGVTPPAADTKPRFAPALDYKQAAKLFPRNPDVKAGAHKKPLESQADH